ncbi:MAG: hypothetical protein HFH75_05955 [Lachnospiraceae bacterium]|jgi:hypothetical protein|nr:hypothetical protein [Lachnospiraceae bacterium]
MQKKTTIYQRLTEEGADPALLEQYRRYQETGNTQGQCGLICRFRREKMKEIIFQRTDMVKTFPPFFIREGRGRGSSIRQCIAVRKVL